MRSPQSVGKDKNLVEVAISSLICHLYSGPSQKWDQKRAYKRFPLPIFFKKKNIAAMSFSKTQTSLGIGSPLLLIKSKVPFFFFITAQRDDSFKFEIETRRKMNRHGMEDRKL